MKKIAVIGVRGYPYVYGGYETLVKDELQKLQNENYSGINPSVIVPTGKATGRMSAQSIAHLVMVLFIIFGNISYFVDRKMRKKD